MTTLLATGAQAASGTGSGVDVSALAILRCDIDLGTTDLPGGGEVDVAFDHGPTATGPWNELQLVRMCTGNVLGNSSDFYWPSGKRRVILHAFNSFMRVRWTAKSTWGTPTLTLGVAG